MEYILTEHTADPRWWAFWHGGRRGWLRRPRIYACSRELRQLGVRPGMPVHRARRLVPHIKLLRLPSDLAE